MYKFVADKYENLRYDKETLNMIMDILKDVKYSYKVLEALANNQKMGDKGLSRSMMYKTIKIKPEYSSKKEEIFITRNIADKILYLLMGAGLIYYDIETKEIYYALTQRGAQVCQVLKNNKLIKIID